MRFLRSHLPELFIAAILLFFALRELGTFPDLWEDDSLFMIAAKSIAEGKGYGIPVLTDFWHWTYILAIGPTLLYPVAAFIWLFGFSPEAARIPMVIYLLATAVVFYLYTYKSSDRGIARWGTLLLVTFSAFVNTGKPVMGEIPGFFFLIVGLYLFDRGKNSWKWAVVSGGFLGLAVVTKLTLGLIFPAIAAAFLWSLWKRDKAECYQLLITGISAVVLFLPFMPMLGLMEQGGIQEVNQYGLAEGGTGLFQVLRTNPEILLRFQYLYFGFLVVAGFIGLHSDRVKISRAQKVMIATVIVLFILYFLNERGWYRHLLTPHLLLLPFVPVGLERVLRKRMAAGLMIFFIAAQFWWQWDHKGARRTDEGVLAAAALEKNFSNTRMVMLQPDIFVRLPENPQWLFLSEEFLRRDSNRFRGLPIRQEDHCLPIMKKLTDEEKTEYAGRTTVVHGRYFLVAAPESCKTSGKKPL